MEAGCFLIQIARAAKVGLGHRHLEVHVRGRALEGRQRRQLSREVDPEVHRVEIDVPAPGALLGGHVRGEGEVEVVEQLAEADVERKGQRAKRGVGVDARRPEVGSDDSSVSARSLVLGGERLETTNERQGSRPDQCCASEHRAQQKDR